MTNNKNRNFRAGPDRAAAKAPVAKQPLGQDLIGSTGKSFFSKLKIT
jgi:hypothetical protein